MSSNLYLAPKYPATQNADLLALQKYLAAYELEKAQYYEKVLMDNKVSPFRVPDTTIDLGSVPYTFASAASAFACFFRSTLPNQTTTTSSTFQTALNYTGKGILQTVLLVAQVNPSTSTAAGASAQITIDGNVVYTGAALVSVNTGIALVGRLQLQDPVNDYVLTLDDPVGLTFNKTCKIEFKSGTNGQGVSLGWKVLKLH